MTSPRARVNSVRFNQDNSCFVAACDDGFLLHNTNPAKTILHVRLNEPIAFVEPLFRCSIVALVGRGATNCLFPNNKVVIFDCFAQKAAVELDVGSVVRNVLLRRDRIVVAIDSHILVYSLADIPEHLMTLETGWNSNGVCSISQAESNALLAFPSKNTGYVGALTLNQPATRFRAFRAHNHAIQAISVNLNGSLIATTSVKGTLVRLFESTTMRLMREFRRGTNNAIISCVRFSADSTSLCVGSNRTTVHLFSLTKDISKKQSFIERCLGGHKSFLRLHTHHTNGQESDANSSLQCAFNNADSSVIVLNLDATLYKFDIDADNLACLQWTKRLFIGEGTHS